MSVATESYQPQPPSGIQSSTEQRHGGFTAANGRSPSRNNSTSGRSAQNGQTDDTSSESASSNGKRKTVTSPTATQFSPKRQRKSPPPPNSPPRQHGQLTNQPRMQPHQDPHAASGHQRPDMNGGYHHSRQRSTAAETHIAPTLTNEAGGRHQDESLSTSPEQQRQRDQSMQSDGYRFVDGIQQQSQQGPPGQQSSPGQKGSAQRKRNFSNRTKTGCLTCRNRKKKCDERKPACNNCERGGFTCQGYTAAGASYTKPPPAQSSQTTIQPQQGHQYAQHYYAANPNVQGYYEQAQASQHRPVAPAAHPDPRAQQYAVAQQWAPNPHYPQQQEQMHRPEYHGVPIAQQSLASQPMQLPDMSRQHAAKHPPPEPIHPAHIGGHNPPQQTFSPYGAPNGQPVQYTNLQNTARLASSQPPQPQSRAPQTEKEKMFMGHPFDQRDSQLKQERHDCQVRVHRFNKNAIEPGNLSDSSRKEHLRSILEPESSKSPNQRKQAPPELRPVGHLGKRVEIEAPFNCEYGYNISIGDDVEIGAGTLIADGASVTIGARTVIGPGVKILTLDADHYDISRIRTHQKRLMKAASVTIGEDVFIGAGAIVLPGKHIPNGATVGAGTIVNRSLDGPVVMVSDTKLRRVKSRYYQHSG